ncbi:hypothetical protein L218DRAFT_891012, partial [Marasmius fiardii PR-910]
MVAANVAAENALGTLGAVCWMVQLIPQIWKTFRTKNTEGLSEYLVLIWGISGAFLGTYTIIKDFNIPLVLQPHIFTVLALVSWGQASCLYYGRRWSVKNAFLAPLGIMVVAAAFEVAMVFVVRPSYREGLSGGITGTRFFGIFFSVLLAIGLLPEYYEICKHGEVIGISITFMLIDALGGVFSDLSLIFAHGEFDIIAAVGYTLVFAMDMVIVVAALILNPLARRKRNRMAAEGNCNELDE